MADNNGKNLEHAKDLGRIDVKNQELEKMVDQHGANIYWERSIFCSCLDIYTGQPDFTCPSCKGKGYFYFGGTQTKALVYSINAKKDQYPIGMLDVGTSYMTCHSYDRVAFRDRITFLDMKSIYSQVVTFTGDPEGEILKYKPLDVITLRNLGQEIPSAAYTIEGNRIKFQDGLFNPNDRFSILMEILPTYVVIDIPHELRGTYIKFGYMTEQWMELPKQYMIKREDLMPSSPDTPQSMG